jgi:hypothetical protein
MTREVVLTETVQLQMNAAADWYATQNSPVAAAWFNSLINRLDALLRPIQNLDKLPISQGCPAPVALKVVVTL